MATEAESKPTEKSTLKNKLVGSAMVGDKMLDTHNFNLWTNVTDIFHIRGRKDMAEFLIERKHQINQDRGAKTGTGAWEAFFLWLDRRNLL